MSAAEKLVIVETSADVRDRLCHRSMEMLEAFAGGESGCSYAFESYDGKDGPTAVDFHVTSEQGLGLLEGTKPYEKSLRGARGGTFLDELFGAAIAKHVEVHGKTPSEIIFWSCFLDRSPNIHLMEKGARGDLPSLKESKILCVAVDRLMNSRSVQTWALRLSEETGAPCNAVPFESVQAMWESNQIAKSMPCGETAARAGPRI